jgi:beta-aspartyl-peptidase (threonine type)
LKGGSAVRAVAAAVTVLEDNELFNAGRGAALCHDGTVELSASIMNGRTRSAGAMVGLKHTRNPVLAAYELMDHAHCLLFGAQGDAYANAAGIEQVPPEFFRTSYRERQWQRQKQMRGAQTALDHNDESAHGTVGAVARDRRGNLAAATSTGGLVNQLAGRVGDTPVIGAGTWADNRVCAVSATGKGDAFARVAFARRVADLIELAELSVERAALSALHEVSQVNGEGGCLILSASGELAMPFTTPQMLRGWAAHRDPPTVAILPDEAIKMD